ncbi:hypothetical protein U7230_02640 [Carboxydochorda subterranea]|uniref:WD40 repeat protein n=1 Tax=Carboxydichorda subterranea TaxID=3109565 RepID=A0ABZ1BZA8_9FIRM|nr:hypothetical protein [Limnochorda sp. L945t]WRP17928.1 hypothetical protein U7230_02640 [Limnochorda sp. L945t]
MPRLSRSVLFARLALSMVILAVTMAAPFAGPAQAGERWWTLETPHFLIHFPDGYEPLARQVAEVAERVHPVVSARVGHTLAAKTHVVLQDVLDGANAFTQPALYNQISLFTVPPLGLAYQAGMPPTMNDWLELLFTHEYVHAVHLDMADGLYAGLRRIFGHVPTLSTPNASENYAFIEGYASYEETLLDDGRGAASYWDMFLRTAFLEQAVPAPDQVAGLYDLGQWNPAGGVYLYGYSWQAYLAERFGDPVVSRVHQLNASLGSLGRSVTAATKEGLGELYDGWRRSLQERYAAQERDVEARGLTAFELLPGEGWVVEQPRFSPDGKSLAYLAAGGTVNASIRIRDLATGKERALAEGATGGFDWTPDGRYLVYAALAPVEGGRRQLSDLFAVEVSTAKSYRLSTGLRAFSPAISSDGRSVAFVQVDGTSVGAHVAVADLSVEGGRPVIGPAERWYTGRDGTFAMSVAWQPGSRRLAVGWAGRGRNGISLLEGPGDTPLSLVEEKGPVAVANPSFTPDGRYLLYESDRTGVTNLYAQDLGSGHTYQLTNVLTGAFFPAASPDGRRLAFAAYTAGGYRVAAMPLDRSAWREPDPPFEGPHWERAAWRKSVEAGANEGGQADASTYTLRPYSPWPSLAPTWWLPFAGADGAGWSLVTMTGGWDARMQHIYTAVLTYGLSSRLVGGALSYRWLSDPLFNTGWSVSALVSKGVEKPEPEQTGAPTRVYPRWDASVSVGYTLDRSMTFASPVRDTFYAGLEGSRREGPQTSSDAMALGGWTRTSAWGPGRAQRSRTLGLEAGSPLAGDDRPYALARWEEGLDWRLGGSVAMRMAAAVSDGGSVITLSQGHPLELRGLQGDEGKPPAPGTSAYKLTLEGRAPLARINRGPGLWPVFLGEVALVPFLDAGVVAGVRNRPDRPFVAASVGAQVQLDVYLSYGSVRLRPALGAAYVFGEAVDRPQWRLVGNVSF